VVLAISSPSSSQDAAKAPAPAKEPAKTPTTGKEPPKVPAPDKESVKAPATDKEPANLRVLVPAEARVMIDDAPTKQSGTDRQYVTPPLPRGKTYTYVLKASWLDGGREIIRMAVAKVEAGKEARVDLREGSKDGSSSQIIYVPTAPSVVDKMLDMAKIGKEDVVYDLGCGDGRILVAAAKKYGVRGVGVDIDPVRVKEAKESAQKAGVSKLIEIRHGDALKVPDLSRATVVMLYMLPEFMEKLGPTLKKELKPGTRVVAHDYPVPNWKADVTFSMPGVERPFPHTLYLWRITEPAKK
jgi:uncharacterized protein (TIGR03000 family)